jgi:hypothetical protein
MASWFSAFASAPLSLVLPMILLLFAFLSDSYKPFSSFIFSGGEMSVTV